MIIVILTLGLMLRLWNLGQSLWLDEAAQAIESSQPWWVILNDLGADFHPPLFHILLSFWIKLGTAEWQMRLLPVIFSLLTIWIVYIFVKSYSQRIALIAALLLAINPFFIYYSQELRPYMMGCFFSVLSIYMFWKALTNTKLWIWFIVVSILHIYTSYFGIFILVGQCIFLLQTSERKKNLVYFLGSVIITTLFFIPWVPTFLTQLRISDGIKIDLPGWSNAVSTPVVKLLPLTFVKFIIGQINFTPRILYGVVAILFSTVWMFLLFKSVDLKSQFWRYCFCLLSVGLLLPTVVSLFLQIAAPKRLLFDLPLIIILISMGIEKLEGKWKYLSLMIVTGISLFCVGIYETNPQFQRENWKEAVEKVESLKTEHSTVLFKFTRPLASYTWYAHQPIETFYLAESLDIKDEDFNRLDNYLLDKKTVFIFHYLGDLTDPNHKLEKKVESNGFHKLDTFDYSGVGLIDYYQK